MAKIYRMSDIIPINIDGLVVNISPLSFEQKMQVQSEILKGGVDAAMRAAKMACQMSIKRIDGIENQDGSKYELKLEDGKLSNECWDDLQNIDQAPKMITVCLNLINGIPKEFVDPENGKALEGVSIIKEQVKGKKK